MIYPSVATLEQLLWAYLNQRPELTAIADVTEMHPKEHGDLENGIGRVVVSYINDSLEGSIVSRKYLEPQIQFACWDLSYFQARRLQELVIEVLENRTGELSFGDQYTVLTTRENSTGPEFDSVTALYFATVTYRFMIHRGSV